MSIQKYFPALALSAAVALLAACVSQPATTTPVAQPVPPAPTAPAAAAQGSAAKTEQDTAAAMEKKFQDAAKGYKVVERDGKTMYCKREKRMGTTIPTMQCMTEAQLRSQVETMEDARERMRNSSKCTMGAGCGAGG